MKVIGIIAEYNPFHNGHAYQISEIRRKTGADYILAAMSGDFVQRGAPALLDKYARTRMALLSGVDLVLELPALWATSSAESFAMAGVTLLEKTGCVDGICFGAETDDLPLLSSIADILTDEPEAFRNALSLHLKHGDSFPKARAAALSCVCTPPAAQDAFPDLLNAPNNILALEYLKALKRRRCTITPYPLRRRGAGYHDTQLRSEHPGIPIASATAIRKLLLKNTHACDDTGKKQLPFSSAYAGTGCSPCDDTGKKHLSDTMPVQAYAVLEEYQKTHPLMEADDFSLIPAYLLLQKDAAALSVVGGCTQEIANRLWKNRFQFQSFSRFCTLIKSRNVTYTRISRILLHLILGITSQDYILGRELDYIPFLRILGFRKSAAPLLSRLKSTAAVPVISKLADAHEGQKAVHRLKEPSRTPADTHRMPADIHGSASAHRTTGIHKAAGTHETTGIHKAAGAHETTGIHKAAGAYKIPENISGNARRLLQTDISASELYRQVQSAKAAALSDKACIPGLSCSEYSEKIVIVP